jgi:hypothetical protein
LRLSWFFALILGVQRLAGRRLAADRPRELLPVDAVSLLAALAMIGAR